VVCVVGFCVLRGGVVLWCGCLGGLLMVVVVCSGGLFVL
jgi:hypothetical protein